MTKTSLQDGLDAYARGDYLAAARAWSRGRVEDPKDQALTQYLDFLRNVAPAVVAGAEEEAVAAAKVDRPPAAIVREPSGAITPLIDAPESEYRRGTTIDMHPSEIRPNKTIDMRPTEALSSRTIDLSVQAKQPQAEDVGDMPKAHVEEGRAEWSPHGAVGSAVPVIAGEGLASHPAQPAHDDGNDERVHTHEARDEDPEEHVSALTDVAADTATQTNDAPSADHDADASSIVAPPLPPLSADDSPNEPAPLLLTAVRMTADSGPPSPALIADDGPLPPPLTADDAPLPNAADPWGAPALLGPTAAVSSAGPGLALVAEANKGKPAPVVSVAQLAARMRDAAGLDDFSGALKAASELLAIEPLNVDAKRIRERARSVLTQMLVSELGTLDAVPMVTVAADQIIWLDLDQRSGFVLAQVDGRSSFSDIVAVTGMDELETLGILARLVRDKIVAAR